MALQLEARFSKDELLLSYLNRVYLGVGWGFEDAAQAYFDRSASALTLPQAALLVGLLPSPNGHDPCRHPEAALSARNAVLNKMVERADSRLIKDAQPGEPPFNWRLRPAREWPVGRRLFTAIKSNVI